MIFPLLRGFFSFRAAPVTWILFALNAAVLLWGWGVAWTVNDRLDALMSDEFFLETQGHIYENYLKERSTLSSDLVREIASTGATDSRHYALMGHLAFRDQTFLSEAPAESLFNDEVAVKNWKHQLRQIHDMEEVHPSFLLGLSTEPMNHNQWVTYIFSHTSGWHFFGNMIFLLIFGGALEEVIGGLGLMTVFLATGIFAAVFFLWMCGATTAPLIGASGAISGIMAMFCVLCWNRPIRYIYWLVIPSRNSLGFVFLPAWTILVIWLIGDLAGFYGNLDIMGGVAHAAHLGGDVSGALAGVIVLGLWRLRDPKLLARVPSVGKIETWHLYPFFDWYGVRERRRMR